MSCKDKMTREERLNKCTALLINIFRNINEGVEYYNINRESLLEQCSKINFNFHEVHLGDFNGYVLYIEDYDYPYVSINDLFIYTDLLEIGGSKHESLREYINCKTQEAREKAIFDCLKSVNDTIETIKNNG